MATLTSILDPERRQSLRLPYDGPVEVEPAGRGAWISGEGRDLSEGGLCVRLPERFDLHTVVRVRLVAERLRAALQATVASIGRAPVECVGRVAWTTARMDLAPEPPYPYDIGIEFVKLPPLIRRQLTLTYERLQQRQPQSPSPRLKPARIGGHVYDAVITREPTTDLPWHLVVRTESVPCYGARFQTAAKAAAGWDAFRRHRAAATSLRRTAAKSKSKSRQRAVRKRTAR